MLVPGAKIVYGPNKLNEILSFWQNTGFLSHFLQSVGATLEDVSVGKTIMLAC